MSLEKRLRKERTLLPAQGTYEEIIALHEQLEELNVPKLGDELDKAGSYRTREEVNKGISNLSVISQAIDVAAHAAGNFIDLLYSPKFLPEGRKVASKAVELNERKEKLVGEAIRPRES